MSYYFSNDESVRDEEKEHLVKIKNQDFYFTTNHGVFSKKGLDFGTRTLLEALDLSKIQGRVLDFGCGYGPIGIFVKKNTNSEVEMIDINQRCLTLAKKNAEKNKVSVTVYESNLYENVKGKFDYIITNPPIRVGKKILYQILLEAKSYLKEHGELIFVIHKDQGAKSVMKDMENEYTVTLLEKNKGFYIICCKN